jgi:ribosomal protein S27E
MALTCKYCGREVLSSAGGKLTFQGSDRCNAAPGGKHIVLAAPGHCVYCGRPVKPSAGGRLVFNGSDVCSVSPTKKHALQD